MFTANRLNQTCHCVSMDESLLDRALAREGVTFDVERLRSTHPHLLSGTAVFVDDATLRAMREVVGAVERVVALPAYRTLALADAHPHAHTEPRARGVFLGYDFHLGADGPQLIEINTNAGGGILNAVLRRAQRTCCEPVAEAFGVDRDGRDVFFAMFRAEWRLARGDAPLTHVAIVDDAPEAQYLYPEFELFVRLCKERGIAASIVDARTLRVRDQKLWAGEQVIDLVYNRLTDFSLSDEGHRALAQALTHDLAVITPHPRAHALYADKRRLATLSDADALRALGAAPEDAEQLVRHVPRTRVVTPADRDSLWRERKALFFKPQSGYGSKAAYRGDKITKSAFEEVLAQPYVAQKLVPPSGRTLRFGDETRELKADIRNFAYAGEVQLVCARLYQGQTTNFRTQGGGFAPVYATRS